MSDRSNHTLYHHHLVAMASNITVTAVGPEGDATFGPQVEAICQIFHDVETHCTRFDPTSDLMRANAAGEHFIGVHSLCADALREAFVAYEMTEGAFDPRIFGDLVRLGYGESFLHRRPHLEHVPDEQSRPSLGRWTPRFRDDPPEVSVGPLPIDLGGIGKGLSLRWCAKRMKPLSSGFLLEAGGDVYVHGVPLDDAEWRIGIEHPSAPDTHVAILGLSDRGCATSSVRVRRWQANGQTIHHLIDPSTGRPGGEGLASATVVHDDPAIAEVWSKVLFLRGEQDIADASERHGIAAFWVFESGSYQFSPAMEEYVRWTAP
ncbi:MAG: FAD:protein FMN transferase [Acidimicrobiales bacterium]